MSHITGPETQPMLQPRDELGGSTRGRALGIGVVALSAGLVFVGATPADSWAGFALGLNLHTEVEDSTVAVKHLVTKPIQMECRSVSAFDVSDTSISYQVYAGKVKVKGAYQKYLFKSDEGGKSIVEMVICQDEEVAASGTKQAVTMEETAPENGSEYATSIITIDSTALTATPVFERETSRVQNGPIWNGAGAAVAAGSAATNGICQIGNGIKSLLGGDDDSATCDAVGGKINDLVDASAKTNQEYSRRMILEAVQKQGATAIYAKSILPAFFDSYACEIDRSGGDISALRFEVIGQPTFDKTMFDSLADKLPANDAGKIDLEKSDTKVVVTEAEGSEYTPECYSTATIDSNGYTVLAK